MSTKRNIRQRLDCLLMDRGLYESREKAQRAILAGEVLVGTLRADKPGTRYATDVEIQVKEKPRYVSRGGFKLEEALRCFGIDPRGRTCLDVGASTGGFTDCLLQHGAARVYAFDVGHSQLDWKIRADPRVVVREKINARFLTDADFSEPVDLCVIDVSFISLTLILPAVATVLASRNELNPALPKTIVALIKPQFELEREAVGRGGIVREAGHHERAVQKIREFAVRCLGDWGWTGVTDSPILGTGGNKEFLACLRK